MTFYLAFYLALYLAFCLTAYLTDYLTFDLTHILQFYLAFLGPESFGAHHFCWGSGQAGPTELARPKSW